MRPNISFLIGSGFSVPEGLPSVEQINKRLLKIDENEIFIHTSQYASFLNGQTDPNRWSNWDERLFLQKFLEFYNASVLKKSEKFHYETFYDFYFGYLHNKENKDAIEEFYKNFNEKYFKDSDLLRDCYNRIWDFNRSYSQLLASLLMRPKDFSDITTIGYPLYDAFIGFIRKYMEIGDIKIHSLNHDLFLDWLLSHHSDTWQYFTDGFTLEGSPYYGIVSKNINQPPDMPLYTTYHAKLPRFTGEFDKPISLFKLHGSIFNTIIHIQPGERPVRLKGTYGISDYYMEIKEEKTKKYCMEQLIEQIEPDFLNGTTNKTRHYVRDPFYINLFKHFESNLSSSELLIVVGYGFRDPGINEFIERYFLSMNKLMVVIDPFKPNTDLIDKYKAKYIPKRVEETTFEDFITLFGKDGAV